MQAVAAWPIVTVAAVSISLTGVGDALRTHIPRRRLSVRPDLAAALAASALAPRVLRSS
jgi:hypothetical protein